MAKKIVVIDDEDDTCDVLTLLLEGAGYKVTVAYSGQEGLEAVHDSQPDLVLLDIMMPGMNGWQVCRHLLEITNAPIIMLTVLCEPEEITRGLQAGADDYVTKPWSNQELLARVQAALRRAYTSPTITEELNCSWGALVSDPVNREVSIEGKKIRLTPTEFRVLTYLARRSGRLVPYAELLAQVWGGGIEQDIDCLRWHIHNLRQKIEKDPSHPRYLWGKYGIGYRFVDPGQRRAGG
jgi:DNA-binding response OmpR family regulator